MAEPPYCRFCCLPITEPSMVLARITSGELDEHAQAGEWPKGTFHLSCWQSYLIPGLPPPTEEQRTYRGTLSAPS